MTEPIASSKYNRHSDPGIACTKEEGRTKQSFTDDCDINKILERFSRTGQLPESKPKQYGDFTNVPDYVTAFNIVSKAQEQFYGLDAKVRAKFDNDPESFLEFATKPSNIDEMVKLGLATKSAVAAPVAAPEDQAVTNKPEVTE